SFSETPQISKKDTNQPPKNPDTITNPRSEKINLKPQTCRQLPSHNPEKIVMDGFEKGLESNLGAAYFKKNLLSERLIFALIAASVILVSSFLRKKDEFVNAQAPDKDPSIIEDLFKEYQKQIGLFRNPRKILRFKNIIRYHYYFLKANGIADVNSLR